MWFPNATKWISPCSNWCESDGWIHIFMTQIVTFWIQPSDLSIQTGFSKKNKSKSEMGVWSTWIPQCHICYHNVAYTCHVYGISVLSQDSICAMRIRQWKTCKSTSVILYVQPCMRPKGQLNPEIYYQVIIFWIQPSNSSVQIFPRKKKVRSSKGCPKHMGYHNVAYTFGFTCCTYGISALGLAGTHCQLCIADHRYRVAAGICF